MTMQTTPAAIKARPAPLSLILATPCFSINEPLVKDSKNLKAYKPVPTYSRA